MQVNNPTGSGGSGTVQTDGVTIQGDGSAGNKIAIKQVETDASLIGAGTLASTLKVAPATFFTFVALNASGGAPTASTNLWIAGFTLSTPLTFSKIAVNITTADAAAHTDFGVYNPAGTLIANLGATAFPATGVVSTATVQGAQTITPGNYIFAMTFAAGGTAKVGWSNQSYAWCQNIAFGSITGGTLPASITPPAVAPATTIPWFSLF